MKKNYYCAQFALLFTVVLLAISNYGRAQTTLISPTGVGGFESGATFALNGWSVVGAAAAQNQWACGTGATAGFSGTRCAYVSNTSTNATPTHTYTIGPAVVKSAYLFRNVTVPAGESQIALNFNWIGYGEFNYDRIRVWCAPTTYTPTYGTPMTTSGVAPTGIIQVGLTQYNQQPTWTSAFITIPPAYAGTSFRLIFEWVNDTSLGVQPPGAVDNISLVSSIPAPLTNDECASAIPLTVNSSCIYSSYTNVGATASAGVPAPGCAGYLGGDVWFSAVVPASGVLVVDMQSGGILDSGLALYSGTCGALSLIECDDDDSVNGAMSSITRTGLTPGATIYIMVWEYGNDSNGTFAICVSTIVPLTNDDCASAIPLTVGTSCSYTTYTNAGATASVGVPAPGCASYAGGDVWFSAIVPANGVLIVDMQSAVILDSGLAFYSGTCGGLTLIECDDDDSVNGAMSTITRTGLTPGSTIYIRVWEFGNNGNGTFGICASTLGACAQTPTTLIATAGSTTATISWTAATPAPASGYQYYYSTSPTAPIATTTPSGSTASGITSANLTGLTPSTTYYFWVRSNCNGTDVSSWIGSNFFTGYCSSTSTNSTDYIDNFTTSGGFLNISNIGSGYSPGGYGNFTSQVVSQTAGSSVGFTAVYFDGVFYTYGFSIWIDWNNDLDFSDPGETVYAPGTTAASHSGSFVIPGFTATGNYRMRIRAVYATANPGACGSVTYGETEDYTLSVSNPLPCSSNPSSLGVVISSSTTATISWAPAPTTPANGYQYYYSTSSTTPGTGTFSGSTTSAVTTANLVGLSAGVTYYVWVRSNCGGALGQGAWIGPLTFFIPTCGIGNSTGTTTLGCPAVISGGLGLNGLDPAPIDCISSGCVDLEATYLPILETTTYTVSAIPFTPPYQFGCLKNPVSVNNDDVWSPLITLPFNFCFYGNAYSQCLISSNGAITFNTSTYSPGGYSGWSFANDLPNTNLFLNSIFGVYHDIDPSISGEVGYELITLNTGCRALVASWNNIPMFYPSCNSLLYTGMIVLYENTNVIEIYIKEKRVCATWNSGNAVAGLQNATGTQAVVAPNRNSLSPDWTTTDEAWRFVPAGVPTSTIKWHQGAGTAGPIVGTTNTINVCPTATTIYTAEVTYNLCDGRQLIESESATVTVNKSKTWNGSISTNWNVAGNWTPVGVPDATHCVIVPTATVNCIISGSGFNAFAYTVLVQNGGVLLVNSGNNITVTNTVTVNAGGQFQIKNSASLVQIDNVNNVGNINMERITQPMYRYDYTYWGSPVTQASNFTLGMLSPGTQPDKYYSWTPFIGASFGTWNQESTASIMSPQKGYIVRAPNSFSTNIAVKVPYTANFIGTPNNGDITCPILYGTFPGNNDQYNLLANPYPSAVSAASFLNYASNATTIDGTIYFWTHNSPPSTVYPDPFYNDFITNYSAQDYASWNKIGGVGTMALSGGSVPNGFIAAGQSFFVRSLTTPGNAIFRNTMRVTSNNSQFFRFSETSNSETTEDDDFEKHRLWLNLTNNTGAFNQILVAYAEGATQGWDRGYDGIRFNDLNNVTFYSIIPDNILVIQGRALPFDPTDEVPLGYVSTLDGEFSIRIDHFDGLFETNNIYLEDKLLNIVHDIKQSPYNFTTTTGMFNDRFVLRYTNSLLSVNNVIAIKASAFISDRKLWAAANESIQRIDVYDVGGKLVNTYTPKASSRTFEGDFVYAHGMYFAKIMLENGMVVTQKLINN